MDLVENAGQVSNFNFTITINNEGYNQITNMITFITVEDFETGEILFDGRIYDAEENMDTNGLFYKDVKCESEMAYLNDTCVRAWDIENMTVQLFMQQIIDNHNSHTTPDKQFTLGDIEYNNEITCQTKYENTLNCIISNIANSIGEGYLRVRKVDDIRYLDYIQLYDGSSDDIVLGQNMKDLKWKKDTSNIITRIIPIGKDNLDITSVNNGLDYLDNEEAIGAIGIIEGKLELNDISDANTLMTTAQAKLPDMAKPVYQLASNTLDLSKLGINPNGFLIGTDINIIADAINFNDSYTIITKETDLLDPAHVKITLNSKFGTLTDRQLALQRYAQILQSCLTANKNINTFSLEGIIDTLKNQILSSGSFSQAQVIEGKGILLENTNAGSSDYGALYLGCGIFAIASDKTNGQWNWRTFGTGKGFVADEITSGIINANLIKTGTITSLDGSFSISLDGGHWTTYSDGKKAIDIFNQTISWYDFLDTENLTGQISSNRLLDAQGNPTGKQVLSIQVPHGVILDLASIDENANSPILRIDNYASNSAKQYMSMYSDEFVLTGRDLTGGILIKDGEMTLYNPIDMNGWGFKNVGTVNMSTGVGTSADGYNGWYSDGTKKLIFTNGILTDIQDV
ncbi:phage tail spike protein [Clostridium sp.]|uniref:phage tail spike protein n=1 Tax=Clostridium sp. TaxID=1506 RepID=UPI0039EB5782